MNTPAPFRQTSSLAIVSLVAGILSWILVPFIGSIVAIITGHMARKEIRNAPERLEGDGLAIGGLLLGYRQLVLTVLGVLLLILFFGGIAALATFAN